MTTTDPHAAGPGAYRWSAVWIGVLYIFGTVALILSLVVLGGVLDGPAFLAQVAADPRRPLGAAVLVLLSGLALAAIPILFWPLGRQFGRTLAIGYLISRSVIETIAYVVGAAGWLALVLLSQQTNAETLAGSLRENETLLWNVIVPVPFAIGALMFSLLLYRSRLVPRLISAWGIGGAVLYLGAPLGSVAGLSLGFLMVPLAIQEMVLAAWLIGRGFAQVPVPAPDRSSATGMAVAA